MRVSIISSGQHGETQTRLDGRQDERRKLACIVPELLLLVNQMKSWEDLLGDSDGLLARGDGRVENIGDDFVVDGLVIDIRHHVHDDEVL